MFKSIGCAAVLTLLAGCASWLDDRPARVARQLPDAQARAMDAEMRSRLEVLRRQPDLASDELIRDLEAFLRERERARLARVAQAAATVAALPAPVAVPAAPVAPVVSVVPLPAVPATRAKPAVPERVVPAAPAAVAAVRPNPVPATPGPLAARAEAAAPSPEPVFAAAPGTPSLAEAQALFARGRMLEEERQVGRAVPLYTDASRQGLVAASVRLMELYASGAEGLARNYLAAVRFKDLALQQGAKLDHHNRR
ncbi:hypothetical protein BurJ1DRAFT_1633 [Burkholderiales bacterium JOSHI_001]|nr:hypothetical protein BurJ1DRAFT_1633 [Burkholderiales bacterium JOSHI_001]